MNRRRVARIMRQAGIQGVTRRKRRSLTRADRNARPAPDLTGRDFYAEGPGTRLAGGIACLPTAEGWLCLACWLDLLATREAADYAMAGHHRASPVTNALKMAHGRTGLRPGYAIHSDRGSEYTHLGRIPPQYREFSLWQSCGRTGSCFDKCRRGSFGAVFKKETGTRLWPDRATARAEVFNFTETFCNRRRLRKHKTFGYLTPAETRQRQQHAPAA